MLNKKTVDDINVKGQRVLVRCDFNVPLEDGRITDDTRIVASLPTIKKLIADGGRLILCSHLGRPKGEPIPEMSLAPVAQRLSELLGQEVVFAADPGGPKQPDPGIEIFPQNLLYPVCFLVQFRHAAVIRPDQASGQISVAEKPADSFYPCPKIRKP